jgi:translation initiation factor 2 alpha subunit (eIF-2alpha)
MNEDAVIARCLAENVGVSAIEALPSGGVRLVCMSGDGADRIRTALKSKLIKGTVVRERHRPRGAM